MMMIFLSLLVILYKTPLSLTILLIFTTLMISMKIFVISSSPWLSLILILTILSGMMIILLYMVSLAPNEKSPHPSKKLYFLIFLLTLPTFLTPNYFFNSTSTELTYMLSYPTLMIMMASYLFFTLIIVVYITNLKMGPLRSK